MKKTKFNWKNKKILITGVHGFVGSNLCKLLIKKGAVVFGIHRNNHNNSLLQFEKIKGFNSISYNNIDLQTITELIIDKEIEFCFHLAANVEVKKSEIIPFQTFNNNIFLTLVLLEAFRNSKSLKSLIFTSTDKVYGNIEKNKLPYRESYKTQAINPYEMSKLNCEDICRSYAKVYKLPILITRSCNLYGPGQLNFSALVPNLIRSIITNSIFIPRSNGKLTRDYLYIDDWVKTLIHISEKNYYKKFEGDIFNFGTNDPKSVIEISKLIIKKIDKRQKYVKLNDFRKFDSKNEIIDQSLNSEKAISIFGKFNQTSLSLGLEKTINWYRKYLN